MTCDEAEGGVSLEGVGVGGVVEEVGEIIERGDWGGGEEQDKQDQE